MPELICMGELLVDFIPQEKNCPLKDVDNFGKAAEDPQFMEDLEETMTDFKYVDSDTARELD